MGRWAKWQVHLFWASTTTAMVATFIYVVVELIGNELHHALFGIPIFFLTAFSAFLYVERAKVTSSLTESEARYRVLMEEASDPIFVTNAQDQSFVAANKRGYRLTQYTQEELLSTKVADVVDMGDVEVEKQLEALAEGRSLQLEQEVIRKDGKRVPVEVSLSLVTSDLVQAIARPIGERKAIEDALRRSEEVFRAISEMTSDYAFSMKVEPDGSIAPEWLTGAFENVTGYSPEEARARGGWTALVHPDDVAAMAEILQRSLKEGGSAESEFRIVTKSGAIRHVKSWSRFERSSPDGPVERIVGAVSDITMQKTLEEELRKSEIRFAALYERLPVGVFRREWKGKGLEANSAMVVMAGYPDRATFLSAAPTNLWMDSSERLAWLKELEEKGLVRNKEFYFKRYDGTPFWARMTAHCVRDENGPRFIEGVVMDITEEKQLDEELRATLGDLRRADGERRQLLTHLVKAKEEERHRVASDIHDDSVQVMTAVAIELERLARRADGDERTALQRLEERVRDALGRLRTMVFELRPPALDQEGLASALRLYLEEFTLDTGIAHELQNRLDDELDSSKRLVLYRIAQEALTNVRKHSGARQVVVELGRQIGGVRLSITDDGGGFDLASTAASPGHIGLSEMRERAEMSGGNLWVKSSPGNGTQVWVLVPE